MQGGMVYIKKVVNLIRVSSLHIISRNHSNTFLLINLQNTKTWPKENIAARTISSDLKVLTF